MKHLRRYNESKTRILTEDIINECFAHAFDLIKSNRIYEIYSEVETEKDGLYDFFANIGMQTSYIEGYNIDFNIGLYDQCNIEEFKKFIEIMNEIEEGIEKISEIYNVDIIQFNAVSNSLICLELAYNDVKLVSDL